MIIISIPAGDKTLPRITILLPSMVDQARDIDVEMSERNVAPALPSDPALHPALNDPTSTPSILSAAPQSAPRGPPVPVLPIAAPPIHQNISTRWMLFLILVHLIIMGCYGVWVYFDIISSLYPYRYPSIGSGWGAYRSFTCRRNDLPYANAIAYPFHALPKVFLPLKWTIGVAVVLIFLCLIFLSPFAVMILYEPAYQYAYHHACDAWPMVAVLNATSTGNTTTTFATATFYTTHGRKSLFTFVLDLEHDLFHLSPSDEDGTGQGGQTPFLQSILYDKHNYTVTHDLSTETRFNYTITGNCHNDTECLRGAFDPDAKTYELQYDFAFGASSSWAHSTVQSQDNITFHSMNNADKRERTILWKGLQNYKGCTELRFCLADSEAADREGIVGPDALVTLGLILADYAEYQCR
ncbi:hypothetical protein BKA62DRAFT_699982 [Auriculariales sp. MPI-PUGE-AT-0066]|nr:hypothetical protein BKA62DRAFT_699982 [Auriculariales sp. MPI-PUGE-AT-0066]